MGRTIPSFRNVLAMEKAEWKPFRNALAYLKMPYPFLWIQSRLKEIQFFP
ncbi:MAG: hypothetical protein M3275_05225 [Thermoproteota archaeon]|nr:hypothetical protein [Thermoproteota archaeon]